MLLFCLTMNICLCDMKCGEGQIQACTVSGSVFPTLLQLDPTACRPCGTTLQESPTANVTSKVIGQQIVQQHVKRNSNSKKYYEGNSMIHYVKRFSCTNRKWVQRKLQIWNSSEKAKLPSEFPKKPSTSTEVMKDTTGWCWCSTSYNIKRLLVSS